MKGLRAKLAFGFVLVVLTLSVFQCFARAGENFSIGEIVSKLSFNQSVLVSLDGKDKDKKWYRLGRQDTERIRYAVSVTALSFLNDNLKFDLGFVPQDDAGIILASYKIFSMDKYTNLPVLKNIEARIGGYIGAKRIDFEKSGRGNNEADYGLSLNLLSIKF